MSEVRKMVFDMMLDFALDRNGIEELVEIVDDQFTEISKQTGVPHAHEEPSYRIEEGPNESNYFIMRWKSGEIEIAIKVEVTDHVG